METGGIIRTWKNVKILPLWHESSEEICESIAQSGFVYFGKISYKDSTFKNTSEGFLEMGFILQAVPDMLLIFIAKDIFF